MTSLQNRLLSLQQEYEDRWRATERSARQAMETKAQQAAEARQKVEQEIRMLDEEWEREAIASRELAEEQNQIMSDARQAALCEMEAKLHSRQQDMEEQVAAERKRCAVLRNRHLRKTVDCQQEVLRYKQHIEELNTGYRRKGKPAGSTPRRSLGTSFFTPNPMANSG